MPRKNFSTKDAGLVGELNTRDGAGLLGPQEYRDLLNVELDGKNVRRREGWVPVGTDAVGKKDPNDPLVNQDLHIQTTPDVESITMITQRVIPSTRATERWVGTQTALYRYNPLSVGYQKVYELPYLGRTTGFPRWRSAILNDVVVFTNGVGPVVSVKGSGDIPEPIADLVGVGIATAKIVVAYKNFMVIMNVTETSGAGYPSRVIWSNSLNAESWDASIPSATTSYFEILEDTSEIIAADVMGDFVIIYKKNSIWRMSFVGGDELFAFDKIYVSASAGTDLPAFRYSLVNVGNIHVYAGGDGFYAYTLGANTPERVCEKVSRELFDDIDTTAGTSLVGHFAAQTNEVWWSYSSTKHKQYYNAPGELNRTLAWNIGTAFTSFIDAGFSATGNFYNTDFVGTDIVSSNDPYAPLKTNNQQFIIARPNGGQLCRYGFGVYDRNGEGYDSVILGAPFDFGIPEKYKKLRRVLLEADTDVDPHAEVRPDYFYDKPRQITVEVGVSQRPERQVVWETLGVFKAEDYNIVNQLYSYCMLCGAWFQIRLTISGKDNPITFTRLGFEFHL